MNERRKTIASAFFLAGLMGCSWGTDFLVEPPPLPEDAQSVFVAFVENSGVANVHAFQPSTTPWRVLLPDDEREPEELFAFFDPESLETLGLSEGRVAASANLNDRKLEEVEALFWSRSDGLGWRAIGGEISAPLSMFRFQVAPPGDACAVLEPLGSINVEALASEGASPPLIVRMDETSALAVSRGGGNLESVISFTESSTRTYALRLGFGVPASQPGTVLPLRDGRLVIATASGRVVRGRLGQAFELVSMVGMNPDGSGYFLSLFETADGGLSGLDRHHLFDLSTTSGVVVETSPVFLGETSKGPMNGGAAPIDDGARWLYSYDGDPFVRVWDPSGSATPVPPISLPLTGRVLLNVHGFGPALVSLTTVSRFNTATHTFEEFGGIPLGTKELAAWRGRLFAVGDGSWTQLNAAGDPCPELPSPFGSALGEPSIAIFGDVLALTGRDRGTIDLHRLSEP